MPAKANFSIVIVGGGIAGLATAIAMRGCGRTITVLEKSRMNKEVGALISLQPNASKIVGKWGIDTFLRRGEPLTDRAFNIVDSNGGLQTSIKLDTSKYGADRIVLHRQDLHAALKDAAQSSDLPGSPVVICTASAVVDCDCNAGVVTLASGETVHGDLIVGADGVHSVLRNYVISPEERHAIPTGVSAYRMLLPTDRIKDLPVSKDIFDPVAPATTMIIGHDRRVIMGPGRGTKLFGIVALVPDEKMHENSRDNSWTSEGSMEKLLESFAEFPEWVKFIFKQAPELALWQLRDIDSLPTWKKGRTILIGDAAHAMLPTQGQGASQSIEDAEALQAFFEDVSAQPTAEMVSERLEEVFRTRYKRASLIQTYSRQQARPATNGESNKIRLNPAEFMDFNCNYNGAKDWLICNQ